VTTAPAPPPSLAALPLSPELQELLIRADRAAVIGSLARGMAHDLRGPLQTLTLLVDPHGDLLVGSEATRLRAAVGDAVRDLTETVGSFSQIYGPPEREPAPVIVDDLIAQVAELQRYQRGLPAVELELRLHGGLPPVRGLESELRHLLLGLIINAKQAQEDRPGARILMSAAADRGAVRIVVENPGPALSAEERALAFRPFYSTRAGSPGIGLPVARWLAERHGGSVTLEAGERGGVAAVVILPAWRRETA
jgi:signal transduction histidine kinase